MANWTNTKRFYTNVEVVKVTSGYAVLLDGNLLKTPSSADMVASSRPLMEAVASEWESQEGKIDMKSMPLVRLVFTSIDQIGPKREEVNRTTLKFAETDLLCYRVKEPAELIAQQDEQWQPLIRWAGETMGAQLNVTEGIVPIIQPEEALTALGSVLTKLTDIEMTTVSSVAAITGSLIIGLALKEDVLSAQAAAEISLLHEIFQMEKWGEDIVIIDRHSAIRREICEAGYLLELLR